jgi:hypothetical protein
VQPQDSTPWVRVPWEQLAAQRKCPNCDLTVQEDWVFCEYCGAELPESDGVQDAGPSGQERSRHQPAPEERLAAHLDLTPSAQALIQLAQQEQPAQTAQPAPPMTVTQLPAAASAQVLTDLARSAVGAQMLNASTLPGVLGDTDGGLGGVPAGPMGPTALLAPDAARSPGRPKVGIVPGTPELVNPLRSVLLSAYEGKSVGVVGHPVRIGSGVGGAETDHGVGGAAAVLGPVAGTDARVGAPNVSSFAGVGSLPGMASGMSVRVAPASAKSPRAGVLPGVGAAPGAGTRGVDVVGAGPPRLGDGPSARNVGAPGALNLPDQHSISVFSARTAFPHSQPPALSTPPPLALPASLVTGPATPKGAPAPQTPTAPEVPKVVERPAPTYQIGPRTYPNPVSGPGGV